ncbi:phage major capsid protein [Lacticaseibacillus saniviri]|uniref:Major head protein Cps n=1 Tax=Lacticaseibacillus saniviri JCM 17471 = DSM 24301 TaxID=1293598 RepID=A0A0R2MV71_9LACO|nr:phage major capsid protein [Lacticaseibacillus saniviri]KRO17409.1 major head protein Cps [Lacticaseibacillus saniviri JCM 17471 = DSM 24301]
MTMNLNNLVNFKDKKAYYAKLVKDGAGVDEQANAYDDMMNALQNDMVAEINTQVDTKLSTFEANRRVDPKITNEEIKFFNDISTDVGSKNEIVLPETTVNEIFDDLVTQHPLFAALNLKTTGLRLKILKSDTKGAVVWGKIFDEIKGQLDQAFTEEKADQNKVTAFVVVPNDALEYGAAWLKQFVVTQITEAFAVGLEQAFLTGDGNQKPIGLNRNVAKDAPVTGGVYQEKKSAGTITLADSKTTSSEMGGIVRALSKKENGKPVVAQGNTVLVVTPGASIDFSAASMIQNVNGQWVFSLPFGVQIVESEFVPEGKVIAFVKGRYDAYTAGGVSIKQFDQTLAMEDMQLFTAKQFAYGKAKDNNAALVFDFKPTSPAKDFKNPDATSATPDPKA